ncbi:hypothetical protein VZ146_20630 [Enterobacter hormaechei]|uniref:hypothetical protein n=1 Tax=Enterobacter hormaechei TaxID=158836 RepID=UPI002E280768|nr:hypothetical protein [Enterobacter hormaechei]MED5777889.1 hypothetical protein [Enterobacter hormaechei]
MTILTYKLSDFFTVNSENNQKILSDELKFLKLDLRNKIRSLVSMDSKDSVVALEKIRETSTPNEIIRIENVLRAISYGKECIVPQLFPTLLQIKEAYLRLKPLQLEKSLEIIELNSRNNYNQLVKLIDAFGEINRNILMGNNNKADQILGDTCRKYGYSHLALRKAALLQSFDENESLSFSSAMIRNPDISNNNVIVNSVFQCYQERQDYLVLKKSVLNINNKGKFNNYTRDITRFIFLPHTVSQDDFISMLQSCLQSSLLDSIILLKYNHSYVDFKNHPTLIKLLKKLNDASPDINKIADFYLKYEESGRDIEYFFYKHSSAWLECNGFEQYRLFLDTFYEDPDSKLWTCDADVIKKCKEWICVKSISQLLSDNLTTHSLAKLKKIETNGMVTRSAAFNYLIYENDGFCFIEDDLLYSIMGKTKDLDKTINVALLKNTAKFTASDESKIIYYLLISKKSKNESDGFYLRRLVQKLVMDKYNSDIVALCEYIYHKSVEVAEYTYEVFTEDFLARLSHVIKRTPQITETRAALHKWMGEKTGKKAFTDRARTLLIDHQINRVRNEIDDNRIYVDGARFIEWAKDEQTQYLNTVLTNITHVELSDFIDDPQLLLIIEKCYFAFCNNNIFGISSYLGRRIRHGTFRGHLYNNVVNVERKYPNLLRDQYINSKWQQWKLNYENCIDKIIKENLHVESISKRDGLLKPNLKSINKHDIVYACAQAIAKDYLETKDTNNSILIILEYCWRLAEVDLKNVNRFLKSKRSDLLNINLLDEIKIPPNHSLQTSSRDFVREIQAKINEKLTSMYGWFKRPLSVSPKASLSLLYKAVVAEVKETFINFDADTAFDEEDDIELVGGPYHVLYDAFYVVIYNAAKHGKPSTNLEKSFKISRAERKVIVIISSDIKDEDNEDEINDRLKITADSDIDNAQSSEERSGIRKLYHLQRNDPKFQIETIICANRKVTISVSYSLEH